ncbi:hypothetical protein DV515_00004656, partial [Chloebia gouldiae]
MLMSFEGKYTHAYARQKGEKKRDFLEFSTLIMYLVKRSHLNPRLLSIKDKRQLSVCPDKTSPRRPPSTMMVQRVGSRRLYRRYHQRSLQVPPAPGEQPANNTQLPATRTTFLRTQQLSKLLRPPSGAGNRRFPRSLRSSSPRDARPGPAQPRARSPEPPRGTAGLAPSPGSEPSATAGGGFGCSYCVNRK